MVGAIVSSLFTIAEHTLSLYNTKESRKYLDRVIYLKKAYYNEQNKAEKFRNHALMDNAVNELCIVAETIAKFGEPSIKD